jgi:hypothetical protein
MIEQFIATLGALDPEPTAEELADALWLADKLSRSDTGPGAGTTSAGAAPPPGLGDRLGGPDPDPTATSGAAAPASAEVMSQAGAPVGLFPPTKGRSSSDLARAPTVPALSPALPLARALRPLRRDVLSRTETELDEEATAQRVAEMGIWEPVIRPAPERWLDLALVVDAGVSMVVWQRTVVELRVLLAQVGAFRDIRTWSFETDGDRPTLHAGAGRNGRSARSPRELIDPTRRRVVLVVSDCIGRAWQTGAAAELLERWGRAGPVAILQPLPQRLWHRCAAAFEPVRLRAAEAGTPNDQLWVQHRERTRDDELGVPIPVLELEPRWFTPWALLVGSGSTVLTGMALFTGRPTAARLRDPGDSADSGDGADPLAPLDRVRRFRATASPTAFKLAGYLAATPLRLQVMRLVQDAMLPDSRPAHFAEVFLGGLLRRTDGTTAGEPDDVEYDFHEGVRDILLSGLHRAEALRVLRNVWEVIRDRLGSPLDFPALLAAVERGGGDVELERPFAWVAHQVLRRLGGRYSEIAERLGETLPETVSAARPVETPVPGAGGTASGTGGHEVIWGEIPPRNPNFTGRDNLLQALRERLTAKAVALLPPAQHELGGVGKTGLAIEYAYRHVTDYDLVWWVPAEQISLARSCLADLAGRLGVPASTDINRTVDAVLQALRTGRPYARWLLVYDNAGDPDELTPLIPAPADAGHVLITSRDPRWARHAATFEVDVLQRAESVALLRRRVPHVSPGDADRLAETLGDLPMAVVQAAAWQAETGTTVEEYLRLFDRRRSRLRAEDLPDDYPLAHAVTWELAFERLRAESPAAARLLELCAFFGSEPISLRLLATGRYAELPPPLNETLSDRDLLDGAVRNIDRYALAILDRAHDTIQIHRLVQALLHARLTEPEQAAIRRHVHLVLAAANPKTTPGDETAFPQRAEIAPHVVPSGIIDGDSREVRQVSLDQVRYLYVLGDYEGSRRLGEMVLRHWRAKHGPDDEQTLIAGGYLANALRGLGDIPGAARLNGDTLDRMRRALGDDHPLTLITASGVGADLRLHGEFTRARLLDEDTLRRTRRVLGDNEARTLRCANNLGVDRRLMGDFAGALELDSEIHNRYRRLLGDGHRDTILAVIQMARDQHGLGEYRQALELQEESFEPCRALFGPDHALVLEAAISLAVTLRKSGQNGRARRISEETFQLARRRFGDDHHDTLLACSGLANDLVVTGDPHGGRRMAEQALAGCIRVFGEDHPFVHMCAVHLGIALRALGELSAARAADEATFASLHRLFGNDHYYTLCSATGLANDLLLLGEYEKAYELSSDTLARSRRVRGQEHPYTLACAHNHSLIDDVLGAAERDGRAYALTLLRRRLGENHPEVLAAAHGKPVECDIQPTPL